MNTMNNRTAAETDLEQFLTAERARILNNPPPSMPYRPMLNNYPPPPHGPMLNDFMAYDCSAAPHRRYKYNDLNQATWKNHYHKLKPYRASKPPPAPPVHSMRESHIQEKLEGPIADDLAMMIWTGGPSPFVHSAKESPIQEKVEEPTEESTEDADVFGLANEGDSFEAVQDSAYDTMFDVNVRFEWMAETDAMRDTMTHMRDEAKKLQLLKESFLTKIGRVNDAASIVERANLRLVEKTHLTPKQSQALRKETRSVRKAEAKFRDEAAGLWNTEHADYLDESLASYEELIEEMERRLEYATTLISGQKLNGGKKRKRVEE